MDEKEGKTLGLRARITAWITGVLVVMALFFFAFVHHQTRSVYIATLDAALLARGELAARGGMGPGTPLLQNPGGIAVEWVETPTLFLGVLVEGQGDSKAMQGVGAAASALGSEVAVHGDMLAEARRKGGPVARTAGLRGGTFRLMALPPAGENGVGTLVFTPVFAHPRGTEGLEARFAVAAVCLLGVILAGGTLFTWHLIRPIEELRDVSEKIAEGNLDAGVQLSGSAEFVSLSRSINRMRRAIADMLHESTRQNQALVDKGGELESSNRELERAIFTANQMTAEAEIRSYELEHEIAQRHQAEEALRSSEEKYRTIVENMKEGYCEVSRDGCITFVNAAMCEICGYEADEILGMYRGQFVVEEKRDEVMSRFAAVLEGNDEVTEFDYPILRKDGRKRHIGVSVSLIRNGAGDREGYRTIVRDVEARKRYEEELIYMAYHDPLTGLKNRKGFYERLETDILRAKRYGGQVALLYIDIDRFKEVNDTLGHEAGDEVLRQITRRLVDNLRQSDCVARVGGDEFAVVLDNADGCDVEVVVRKVAVILAQPYSAGGRDVAYVSGSVGVALFPEDAVTASDLIRYADSAMYEVKRSRKASRCHCRGEGVHA
ncbi:diguanylate cyclase domain-containing protein [Desulfoluna spongiiphila]|uniref:diguanylate cyclase domain-containing protein n=1 Tax=Desulfoluna spongiiphila TaxID=419481 RepID=UPI00125B5495|nr:diguanylate cyclase [Desulfoluna spongiiphila]VVS90460.1 nucleotide cyclase [Desulfoluna spongiiphila]